MDGAFRSSNFSRFNVVPALRRKLGAMSSRVRLFARSSAIASPELEHAHRCAVSHLGDKTDMRWSLWNPPF